VENQCVLLPDSRSLDAQSADLTEFTFYQAWKMRMRPSSISTERLAMRRLASLPCMTGMAVSVFRSIFSFPLGSRLSQFSISFFSATGSTVAEFSGQTVHTRLAGLAEYKEGNYEAALKRAFLGTDEDLRASPEYASDPSGCTAVAALLVAGPKPKEGDASKTVKVARRIIVANAGDSRSVLSVKGEAKPMSYDHKPGNTGEQSN
jgi:Protein phosphatase 2C